MKITDKELIEILLKGNYIDGTDAEAAIKFSENHNRNAVDFLVTNELINNDLLGQAIAENFGVKYSDLNSKKPALDQVLKIPEEIASQYRIVLFEDKEEKIIVTTDNVLQENLQAILNNMFGREVQITFSLTEDIDRIFALYQKPLESRFKKIIEESEHIAPDLLNEIFGDALHYHASDIHFEPQNTEVIIRFRIDGILRIVGKLSKEHYQKIINRIKVESSLKIDEHFKAQDGSMKYVNGEIKFDLRTSIVPTVEGEKIVLRILESYVKGLSLAELGLSEKDQATLEKSSKKPFGMILVTGPTGSGKTTTLYSVLKVLNRPGVNITTIEDPVEYKVAGINQIQVNSEVGLTFSTGLRSVVRQDPDVILVGEIRDNETSKIAVNAALTGHLLLSTFHANNSSIAIPRLLDMDIEPFLLASTIDVIIAQRLVRKICTSCRYSVKVTPEEIEEQYGQLGKYLGNDVNTLYKGKGCSACNDTGFSGRTAIFEFLHVTPEMQDLIITSPTSRDIWKLAKSQGSKSLFEDGINRVKSGITTMEELVRTISPPKEDK